MQCHMKYKRPLLFAIVFFFIINTSYYWEGKLGMWDMPVWIGLIVLFLTLAFLFFKHSYLTIKERFSDKQHLLLTIVLAVVLALTFFFPGGLVNFEKLESKNVLIAYREGVANCTTTLKLKANRRFKVKSICFGVIDIKGTYSMKGDTVLFTYDSNKREEYKYFKLAVLRNEDKNKPYAGVIVLLMNHSDTIGMPLKIVKNDLHK